MENIDLKKLASAVMEVAEEHGVPKKKVLEILGKALGSAYKKEYGKKSEKYTADIDPSTGKTKFWQLKRVVKEENVLSEEEKEKIKEEEREKKEGEVFFNPERHIKLGEAKEKDKDISEGEYLKIPKETKTKFGRIAAQTAKQVILQRVKEAEKDAIYEEFKDKEGDIVSGIVQRAEPNKVYFDIGRTSGILPRSEQIDGEVYSSGQRFKLYVSEVQDKPKGPVILLSRSYPKLVSKLFELEVPEISNDQVEIKSIAREAGSRTKIAVESKEEEIDAVGALVGQKGTRILAVTNELGGEKIDVVEWSEDPKEYISNALNPADVLEVKTLPKNKAEAIVSSDQLSLAIGKKGQNVRLAAKLTGWKIDVKSLEEKEKDEKEDEITEEDIKEAQKEDEEENEENEEEESKQEKEEEDENNEENKEE